MLELSIAREFSDAPGPRSREEGDFSGELFLDELLRPRFEEALRGNSKLLVDLDGAEGYATSFLEGAFGGLARLYDADIVLRTLQLKSDDEPHLPAEIKQYILDAGAARK
jgi:hypothetical protein